MQSNNSHFHNCPLRDWPDAPRQYRAACYCEADARAIERELAGVEPWRDRRGRTAFDRARLRLKWMDRREMQRRARESVA